MIRFPLSRGRQFFFELAIYKLKKETEDDIELLYLPVNTLKYMDIIKNEDFDFNKYILLYNKKINEFKHTRPDSLAKSCMYSVLKEEDEDRVIVKEFTKIFKISNKLLIKLI